MTETESMLLIFAFFCIVMAFVNSGKTPNVIQGTYEGGIKEWIDRKTITLFLEDNRIRVHRFHVNGMEKYIEYTSIKDIDVKTETQMTSDVTLSRLLLFGVFAFGMKKQNKTETRFLIINYTDEKERNQNLVLSCKEVNEKFYRDFLKRVEGAN